MSRTRHVVARITDVAPGTAKRVLAAGRDIALFNVGGTYYALADRCPHQAGSLCKGSIVGLAEADAPGQYRLSRPGEFVKCPWHGWEFDIRTGQSYCDPATTRARAFDVSVAKGAALMEGPYVAERFDVIVEDDYVVIEI